jgi:hypothetical protein
MSDIFREGWTERIKYALTHDGVTMNLAGYAVALVGQDCGGNALGFTGSIGVFDAPGGIVYFDPSATDLLEARSPYRVRWSVVDGSGRVAYFPRANPVTWVVQLP